ncbi:hypothetical protein BJY52DRAFT_1124203 [Lactarius psammicola]|nr:hypothetical protein BJY52DRAFT_1124203 [Lactarius psammicola]
MALSNDMAALTGFACEALAYGVHCVLFALSVIMLVKRKRTDRNINTFITIANVFLFLICTAHFLIEFHHFYTTLQSTGVHDFAAETKPLVGADIFISLADLIGEGILIYRCWIIWGKNYFIVIIPSLCAVGGFACVAEAVHLLLGINPSAPVAPASLVPIITAGYVLTLVTNVLVTVLIVLRIWYLSPARNPQLRGISTPSRTSRHAIDIMVESGVLYVVTQIIFVVLFAIRHPAQAIIAVIAVQIYGIVPTLIIIRATYGPPGVYSIQRDTGVSWGSPAPVQVGYSSNTFIDGTVHGNEMAMHDFKTSVDSEGYKRGRTALSEV